MRCINEKQVYPLLALDLTASQTAQNTLRQALRTCPSPKPNSNLAKVAMYAMAAGVVLQLHLAIVSTEQKPCCSPAQNLR